MPETLPKSFRDTFARLRKRLHEMYLLQWALVAIGGLLLALLAFALLDRVFFIPEWLRLVFFLLGFLGLLAVGPWRYFRKAYFQSSNIALAQLIKKSRNRLGDRIQGALEISQHAGRSESPELLHAALEQIGEETTQLELSKVLPKLNHHIYALIIAGLVLVSIGGFCLAPKQAANATQRFFFPVAEVPRYSTIRFAKTPKEYYVVAGKPSELVIKLHEKSLSAQEVLGRGKLSGSPEQTLAYENGFHFSLPSLEKKTTFTIQAGDAYKSIQIIPKPRPRISSLQLRQTLPSYLQLRDRTLRPKGARVEVLEGSQVTVELESSQDLQAVSSSNFFAFEHAGTRAWSQQVTATEKIETKLSIRDRYGLQSFPEKTLFMDIVSDRAPSVRLLQVEREFTLLPHETLDLYLSAEDDFGIERIELVLQSLNRPSFMTSSLVKRGNPEAITLKSSFALNPEVLGITPDSYNLSAAAVDYLPEREPTLSAPVTLHLLSYEAHANLIKTQFTVLLDQLDEFYQGSLTNYFENERVSRAFSQSAQTYEFSTRIQDSVKNERKAMSQFNSLVSDALALSEDAFRNPELDRSAQLALTLLSQRLTNEFPPQFDELITAYEQSDNNRFSLQARANSFGRGLGKQAEVLDQLRVLIDEMREFDRRFEASSFVHRLQSLAQSQSSRAEELLREYHQVLGVISRELDPALQQVNRENTKMQIDDSQALRWIEDDLRNYSAYAEKPDFADLADEIKSSLVYREMREIQDLLENNQRYLAIVSSKKWADQIEQWAQSLGNQVAQSAGGGGSGGGGGNAQEQDAEFMFRIMEIVREQQNLRGKTRSLEQQKQLE